MITFSLGALCFLAEARAWSAVYVVLGIVFLVIVLFKLLHVGAFMLLHPHGIGVLGILFVLLLFAFLGIHLVGFNAPSINAQRAAAEEAALRAKIEKQIATAKKTASPQLSNKPQPSDVGTADKHPNTSSISPPQWINQLPHREGDAYVVVVKLDADTNPTERDEWLDQRMLVAAKDYIDERLYPSEDVSKVVKLNAKYLYDNCLRELYPASGMSEAGKEVFARLEFDRNFREEVDRRYRQLIEQDHLRWLGGIGLVGLAALTGLYSYMRVTVAKSDQRKTEVPASA